MLIFCFLGMLTWDSSLTNRHSLWSAFEGLSRSKRLQNNNNGCNNNSNSSSSNNNNSSSSSSSSNHWDLEWTWSSLVDFKVALCPCQTTVSQLLDWSIFWIRTGLISFLVVMQGGTVTSISSQPVRGLMTPQTQGNLRQVGNLFKWYITA